MTARGFNRKATRGKQEALGFEARLESQYEGSLRAAAKRAASAYRRATEVVIADGRTQPPLDEVLNAEVLAESARARTAATRRRIARVVVDSTLGTRVRQPNEFIDTIVAAQAGRQAERLVAGSRETIAHVLLDALNEGWSVPETAAAIQSAMTAAAPWQAPMLARTDLISIANGASLAAAREVNTASAAEGEATFGFKTWITAGDDRVRDAHVEADGQTVPIDSPFDVDGEPLEYPGDPAASDGNTINCFPADARVEFGSLRFVTQRWYEGDFVRVRTASGNELAGTPNHPVLRSDGKWVGLGELQEGHDLVCASFGGFDLGTPHPDSPPAEIGEVYDLASACSQTDRVGGSPPDFHGDGSYGEVDVVTVDGSLLVHREAASDEDVEQFGFALAARARSGISKSGDRSLALTGDPGSPSSLVRLGNQESSVGLAEPSHPESVGLATAPDREIHGAESPSDGGPGYPEGYRDGKYALPVFVATDEIVLVERYAFIGHVYNLDTGSGWYSVNGVVARNCRCTQIYTENPDPELAHSDLGGIQDVFSTTEEAVLAAGEETIMPWEVEQVEDEYCVFRSDTGDKVSCHDTQEKALAHVKALYANVEHASAGPLVASIRVPEAPPSEWFEYPTELAAGPTALTVTEDGRVFGHITTWDQCHTGFDDKCVTPPRNLTYDFFHTGVVDTVDGGQVRIGKITAGLPHASLTAGRQDVMSHYDNTEAVVAFVHAGEDEHGPWVAGTLRPDASEEQVRTLKANGPSGDWRRVRYQGRSNLELMGVLAVPVQGFPIPRAAVTASANEGEQVQALIAGMPAEPVYELGEQEFARRTRVLAARAQGPDALALLAAGEPDPVRKRLESLTAVTSG